MVVFPNAKINIGLRVVYKRDDGFHNIETLFYPIGLKDVLELVPSFSDRQKFSVSGLEIDGSIESNLVMIAKNLIERDFKIPAMVIHLHKIIPFGAGLGGGSSNAAFMLSMLNQFYGLKISESQLMEYAESVGSDCPFFILNKPALGTEKGTRLDPVNLDLSKFYIVLVHPRIKIATSDAYAQITPKVPDFSLSTLPDIPVEEWKDLVVNDFESVVFPKYPQIAEIKQQLYNMGAVYASMSGSGSSVYGLFYELPQLDNLFGDYFVWSGRMM